jgi:addiction module HigA family antidote
MKTDTIGNFIQEELIEPYNMSVNQVANATGINQPTLKRILDGKISLSVENAVRLECLFGFSHGYLSRLQTGFDLIAFKQSGKKIKVTPLNLQFA